MRIMAFMADCFGIRRLKLMTAVSVINTGMSRSLGCWTWSLSETVSELLSLSWTSTMQKLCVLCVIWMQMHICSVTELKSAAVNRRCHCLLMTITTLMYHPNDTWTYTSQFSCKTFYLFLRTKHYQSKLITHGYIRPMSSAASLPLIVSCFSLDYELSILLSIKTECQINYY